MTKVTQAGPEGLEALEALDEVEVMEDIEGMEVLEDMEAVDEEKAWAEGIKREDWRIGKGRKTERADWRHGCVEAWMHGKSGNSKT